MIGEKTTLEILLEIQNRLKEKNLPVKIDLSEPIEGADVGLKVIVNNRRNWSLEKQIIHEIMKTWDHYDLILFLEWEFPSALKISTQNLHRRI